MNSLWFKTLAIDECTHLPGFLIEHRTCSDQRTITLQSRESRGRHRGVKTYTWGILSTRKSSLDNSIALSAMCCSSKVSDSPRNRPKKKHVTTREKQGLCADCNLKGSRYSKKLSRQQQKTFAMCSLLFGSQQPSHLSWKSK
jgi:hypothetical protein